MLLFGLEEESPRHSTAPLKWASSWISTQSSLCLPLLPSPPKPLGSVYTVSQGRRNLGCWQRWAVLEENRLGMRCWGAWGAAGSLLVGLQLSRGQLVALTWNQREGPGRGHSEAGRRARTDPGVDRGDRTGIRVGRTQKGRKRHQRYRSKGGGVGGKPRREWPQDGEPDGRR